MNILTVTDEGEITLTPDVLRHLGVHPGERLRIHPLSDGRIEIRAADVSAAPKREATPSLSVDEINAIAAEGWARKV